jgi:serine/threonine kinase PknH
VSVPPPEPETDVELADADTEPMPHLISYPGVWGKVAAAPRPPEPAAPMPPPPPEPLVSGAPFAFPAGGRRSGPGRRVILSAAAAVLAVVLAGAVVMWAVGSPDDEASNDDAPTTSAKPARDSAAEVRLMALLPKGYAGGSCTPVDPPEGAVAQVECGDNADAGGPPSATYTVLDDRAALKSMFDGVVGASGKVNCPGNLQSPGPWRRNATPDQVSGTLFCGLQKGHATVAWTDDAKLLLADVSSDPPGPNLDQLYAWWSMHS